MYGEDAGFDVGPNRHHRRLEVARPEFAHGIGIDAHHLMPLFQQCPREGAAEPAEADDEDPSCLTNEWPFLGYRNRLPILAQNQCDRRRQRTHPAQEQQPDRNEMAGVSSGPLCNSSRMNCDRRN